MKMKQLSLIALLSIIILGVFGQQTYVKDPYSNFQHNDYVIQHQDIKWDIDLDKELIQAEINYTILSVNNHSVLQLDCWNLDIDDEVYVEVSGKSNLQPASLKIDKDNELMNYLDISVMYGGKAPAPGKLYSVLVKYNITNASKALTWLQVDQTYTKQTKQIFTQTQAIYARGLFPTQDSPQVKFTWKATITVNIDAPTILMPADLISHNNDTANNKTIYNFNQPTPTSASGFGLFLGKFETEALSQEVSLTREKGTFGYLSSYFSDIQGYIQYLESYLGSDFPHNQLNILIGPDFTPLGAAVYPGLIVLSPDVLPVDITNTLGKAVLINAVARSWFQYNLTPQLWDCQFLSYGIATYLERLVIKKVLFPESDDSQYRERAILGNDTLYLQISRMNASSGLTKMVPDVEDLADPIELVNVIIYEKGFQFLTYLDRYVIGEIEVRDFLRVWISNNTGKAVDEIDFNNTLTQFFIDRAVPVAARRLADVTLWYSHVGMIPETFRVLLQRIFTTDNQELIQDLGDQFIHLGGYALPLSWRFISGATINHKVMFLNYFLTQVDRLNKDPDTERLLRILDIKYNFSGSTEQQILFPWISLALSTDYEDEILDVAKKVISTAGSQSVVLPLYESLVYVEKNTLATSLFNDNKNFYHYLVSSHINRILNPPELQLN